MGWVFHPATGRIRRGRRSVNNYRGPTVAPHNAYRTDPGGYNDWCIIVCHTDDEWRKLVQVMGGPIVGHHGEIRHLAGRL